MPKVPSLLALLGLAMPMAAQPVTKLSDVPALAKARAERQRPALEQKLAPYWDALSRDPGEHGELVRTKIEEVVKLGDSIVPLLLEKVESASGRPADRHLATNCAVVLARLEPKGFTEALINIATGKSYTGQGHAIKLLGMTGSPQAGRVLTEMLDGPRLERKRRRALIRALAQLRHAPAAERIAQLLPCANGMDHSAVMEYLENVPAPAAVPRLLAAIRKVRRASTTMDFVRVLTKNAVGNADAALALLPLLSGEKLDRMQIADLCRALGHIAPKDHEETVKALRKLIDTGYTGDLELAAAVSLRRLGNKAGPKKLLTNLRQKTKGRTRRDYMQHSYLGDYLMAFEDYSAAARSYQEALKHASGPNIRARLSINIARAQAKRGRWADVRRHLKGSGSNYKQLMKYAEEFPELKEAYQQDPVKRFLEGLKPKEQPGANGNGRGKGRGNGKGNGRGRRKGQRRDRDRGIRVARRRA